MGCFAYKTSDTNKTFVNEDFGSDIGITVCFKATQLLPCGEKFTGKYDGYGSIINDQGKTLDIFAGAMASNLQEALDDNSADRLRDDFFDDFYENHKLLKIVEDDSLGFDEIEPSESCKSQGCFHVDNNDDIW